MDRRHFLKTSAAAGAFAATRLSGQPVEPSSPHATLDDLFPSNGTPIPDDHWTLWVDQKASWLDDDIHLPGTFKIAKLPVHPPTGGWTALDQAPGSASVVTSLPATVEQYFWDRFGSHSYTSDEYRYASDDPTPQNGAYIGVSWWWKDIEIPASMKGQRILLQVRSARMRAEVYLNEKLTGYSIMEELPFECDLTEAARPGGNNRLAIRITNPGGEYTWRDGVFLKWGRVNLYRSHGFGGLDRGLVLQAVPAHGRIADAWVLNTPNPRSIVAHALLEGDAASVLLEVVDPRTGAVLATATGGPGDTHGNLVRLSLTCPSAELWDLTTPVLYHLRFTAHSQGQTDVRTVVFGFRWFAPDGLGTNAVFRLNGRRIKLYSAISWGFWGFNGLFPTRELAEREVSQAKKLGLNCLNFHRNVGKEDVFREHDRQGLLRYMEPGGGKLTIAHISPYKHDGPPGEADLFLQQFTLEKCRAMVRAFRSHPSLIQYTLQNELTPDFTNTATFIPIQVMHDEDPSRSVVLTDGPLSKIPPPQAWFPPYSNTMRRSDQEQSGSWWSSHKGPGDQWYDRFYRDITNFAYNSPLKEPIVVFGEMEACAVADNHSLMIQQIESSQFGGTGKSYDLQDHREILAGYDAFLERWGFRNAFPTSEVLFRSLGQKCYESWQQYMENIRICDEVDFACISGWESTSIENHAGIVDNLRNFKGDPALIASSLLPVRPVAKQHSLCYALGNSAVFDLFLLNDTAQSPGGTLRFSMVDPHGRLTELGSWPSPATLPDQFRYLVESNFKSPPLSVEGIYRFRFTCDSVPLNGFSREIWVSDTKLSFPRKLNIATINLLPAVQAQLAALPGLNIAPFNPSGRYHLIVSSGLVEGIAKNSRIGDVTGYEAIPAKGATDNAPVLGRLPDDVLKAVEGGTPLLAVVPNDALSDGVARQLAEAGAFTYNGLAGHVRAVWMGNWLFVREHPTFRSLPTNRALSVHYQPDGQTSNGMLVDRAPGRPDLEVIMGYSRDHDRKVGAASFSTSLGRGKILFHRAPAFSAPLQQRWLANTVLWLTDAAAT